MRTVEFVNRMNRPRRSNAVALAACLTLTALPWAARAQEDGEYQPQYQKIAYLKAVPATIRHAAKAGASTRFFGSFRRKDQTFALHLYDTGPVRPTHNAVSRGFQRDSRLDVFQLSAGHAWRRIQSVGVMRFMGVRKDEAKIEAQTLWLDPDHKTVPMICLKVQENEDGNSSGDRTDIFGVLPDKPTPHAFKSFNGFEPYSMSTVTLAKVSHPDPQGNLTLLDVVSNPGDCGYTAYAWTEGAWKKVAETSFDNAYETAQRWDGAHFVPLAKKPHPHTSTFG